MQLFYVVLAFLLFGAGSDLKAQTVQSDSGRLMADVVRKAIKAERPRQIGRITTKDSILVFGADKARTHLLIVWSHNYVTSWNVQYFYDATELVRIHVLGRPGITASSHNRRSEEDYFFKGGVLVFAIGNQADLNWLVTEGNRYHREGTALLGTPL